MDAGSDLPIGRIRGLRACASARGTFGVLALDHRQNLRRELRPGRSRVGDVRGDGRVQAGRRARARRRRPASCSTRRSAPRSAWSTARSRPAAACSWRSRRPATTARRRPASAACSTAGAWPRPSGSAPRRPSCSSTTTRTRRMRPTRSASSPTWPRPARRRTCRCSSSRCRSRSTRRSRSSTGEARRRVVVETARRLTALGGDILKAEFPYDPGVTDPGAGATPVRSSTPRRALPWVLLSGGVDDATFEAQVRVACAAGASGVLVGRSVWAEAATLAADRARRVPRGRPGATGSPGWSISSTSSAGRGTPAGPARPDARTGRRLVPRVRRLTADRRFDLLVAGELNPDVLVVDPTARAGLRPGRDDRRRDPDGDRQLVGDRRLRRCPPRAADGLRRCRRRRRLRPVHARRARPSRDRRLGLPDRPGRADRRHGDPEPRRRPGDPDRDRRDRPRCAATTSRASCSPPRATSTSEAPISSRRSRPTCPTCSPRRARSA